MSKVLYIIWFIDETRVFVLIFFFSVRYLPDDLMQLLQNGSMEGLDLMNMDPALVQQLLNNRQQPGNSCLLH